MSHPAEIAKTVSPGSFPEIRESWRKVRENMKDKKNTLTPYTTHTRQLKITVYTR